MSVSVALGAGAQDAAPIAAEEPDNRGVTVQFEYVEPAAEVEEKEVPSFKSQPHIDETVSDTDPSWKATLREDAELSDMAMCESGHDPQVVNERDADITGYASHGLFQFQPGTFTGYIHEYGMLPGLSDTQILDHIYDPEIQIELVKKMLQDGLGYHWKNCYYNKYGTGAHRRAS